MEEGQGKRTAHLTPPFYARPWKDGKQRWHRLHAETFAAAKKEAEKLDAALTADAMGLTVTEAANIGNRVPLAVAVRRFMEDNASKEPKTVAAVSTRAESVLRIDPREVSRRSERRCPEGIQSRP